MTLGRVEDLQPRLSVLFHLSGKPNLEIEFVVDTGFQGALSLPLDAILSLGLPFVQEIPTSLADDTRRKVETYRATISWEGSSHEVQVLAMGRRPLLGTYLLANKEFVAQFVPDGLVTVDDL